MSFKSLTGKEVRRLVARVRRESGRNVSFVLLPDKHLPRLVIVLGRCYAHATVLICDARIEVLERRADYSKGVFRHNCVLSAPRAEEDELWGWLSRSGLRARPPASRPVNDLDEDDDEID